MDPITSFNKLAGGRHLRALQVPTAQAATAYAEANESRLVEITGVTHLLTPAGTPAGELAGNANYLLDGTAGALLRVDIASTGPEGLVGSTAPTAEPFDVRGIMSQSRPAAWAATSCCPVSAPILCAAAGCPALPKKPCL
jgi:hypothetical protein